MGSKKLIPAVLIISLCIWFSIVAVKVVLLQVQVHQQDAEIHKLYEVGKAYKQQNAKLKNQIKELKGTNDTLRKDLGASAAIRNYLHRKNSPLANFSNTITGTGKLYGVDARLIVAISMAESGACQRYIVSTYNCFGWGNGGIPFTGFVDGIQTVTKAIGTSHTYAPYQRTRSITVFAQIYNPAHWQTYEKKIDYFMSEIQ